MIRTIQDISRDMCQQDNRCTALPLFIVQQKRRIAGIDTQWGGDLGWFIDGDQETDAKEIERLEAYFEEHLKEPDGYTRTGYVDIWEFVTACFTEKGCEEYLKSNGHNLKESRIYAASGHRNAEWKTVIEHLQAQAESEEA